MKLASLSNLEQPRVLITGIDSFTGQHLKHHLEQSGFCVFGTCRGISSSDQAFTCDITNKQGLLDVIKLTRPGYVVHLAGISFVGHPVVEDFYRVNVLGTQNLLDALVECKLDLHKVILASSATVYGNQGLAELDETLCPQPVNHYGISKLAMEHLAKTYFDKLPILITRPFNYVGVGQPEHFVIPKIVSHFKRNAAKIELGNLEVEREFNSVEFACEVYLRLMTCAHQSQVVNLCSGHGVKLKTLLEQMADIAGYTINIEVNPAFVRANELPKLVGSVKKLTTIIKKLPHNSLKETLETMFFSK